MNLVSFIVVVVVLALAVLALLSLNQGKGTCQEGRKKTRDCSSCHINCPLKNSEFGIRNSE